MATTGEVNKQLRVLVAGGGPVGLTFAVHLTMMMGDHAKITIYEGRWFVDEQGILRWKGPAQLSTRRDQVVTLQDHVIDQMPDYVKRGLFQQIDERVWPTSRNIPIREVEDRLFYLIQPFVQSGQIELVPENLHEKSERLVKGNVSLHEMNYSTRPWTIVGEFDVLVGADGSNSFVRRYCNIQMISEGIEYACGVAYDIPGNVPPSEQPLHQALNCVFTVSQTRYLVNSSTSHRGYLNIRLIQEEYNELQDRLKQFPEQNGSFDLSDYKKYPQSPVLSIIRQGLDFFQISPKYVTRVVPIEINVRHASVAVRELRFETHDEEKQLTKKFQTALAFLAGDAAMCVHFWPGRGMNSGMKAAIALARNILRVCTSNNTINVRTPLRFLDFLDYEAFMARLRAREQQGRSLRVLINPIDSSVREAFSYAHINPCYVRYTKSLVKKLKETRDRFEERSDWPHQSRRITDEELEFATHYISPQTVAQLSLANPWPTREMSGAEVLVEHVYPYNLNNFLPLPQKIKRSLERIPSVTVRNHLYILFVKGTEKNKKLENLVGRLREFQAYQNSLGHRECDHDLSVIETVEALHVWLSMNYDICQEMHVRLKVITVPNIHDKQTAFDVITAARVIIPQAPVLVYANRWNDLEVALEYGNVIVTDKEAEVKEFAGINEGTFWEPGYQMASASDTMSTSADACNEKRFQTSEIGNKTKVPANNRNSTNHSYVHEAVGDCSVGTALSGDRPLVPNLSSEHPKTVLGATSDFSKPLLLWLGLSERKPLLLSAIQSRYPTLVIEFQFNYEAFEEYLRTNASSIQLRKKFIVITRRYFEHVSKSFVDVAQLLVELNLSTAPFAVITTNKAAITEETRLTSRNVQIFDNVKGIVGFLDRHLQ